MSGSNWMNLTMPELKVKLLELGLPRSGKKSDLVARLEAKKTLTNLTIPELKEKLGELGLPRSGKKDELVARLQASGKDPVLKKKGANKIVPKKKPKVKSGVKKRTSGWVWLPKGLKKHEVLARLREIEAKEVLKEKKGASNVKDKPSGSGVPKKKKKTTKASDEKAKIACVKACRKGEQSGCAHKMFNKPSHGDLMACYEVERIIKAMGMNPKRAISKCTKAGIMTGFIKVKGEKGELDKVIYEDKGECGHVIKAKLGDLLKQPDYGGDDYEDGLQNATVICTECDDDSEEPEMGRTYVTGLCCGDIMFDCGKFHNHCGKCSGFGMCIGDYREAHCDACGSHYWWVGGGCSNEKCSRYRPRMF